MILLHVIEHLEALDQAHTIYAKQPWSPQSEAALASPPDSNALVPADLLAQGFSYFLEVSIAQEFLAGLGSTHALPSFQQQCERIIQYAVNDA